MDLRLSDETAAFERELDRWSERRAERGGEFTGFDHADVKELAALGLPGLTLAGGSDVDLVVGIMAAARTGLPGPVVEAQLAIESGCPEAAEAAERGEVVTSAAPGQTIVGWGAVADLVVDQASGTVLASGPLERVRTAYALPHGWLDAAPRAGADPLLARRWLCTSAAVTGLGRGALERAVRHAKDRVQFGRPLASFQAVQFRLAESLTMLEGARLSVLDAAWRFGEQRPDADVAAALTWLWASRVAQKVAENAHQVYGALGFCDETGLVQLTAQMAWFRVSVGRRDAVAMVTARRSRSDGVPASTVLGGSA
jgi:acyl-CoA dehydrogenase-like protein